MISFPVLSPEIKQVVKFTIVLTLIFTKMISEAYVVRTKQITRVFVHYF